MLAAAAAPADDESLGDPHLEQLAELNKRLEQNPDDYEITVKTIALRMQLQHWEAVLALVDRTMEISPGDGWRPADQLATNQENDGRFGNPRPTTTSAVGGFAE